MATERDLRIYLRDMLDAAEKARSFVAGMDYEALSSDAKTVSATIRAPEVVGEVAKNIPQTFRTTHPSVPWVDMAGMRDVLIHEYFGVDLSIVWETLQSDLPPLMSQLKRLLSD